MIETIGLVLFIGCGMGNPSGASRHLPFQGQGATLHSDTGRVRPCTRTPRSLFAVILRSVPRTLLCGRGKLSGASRHLPFQGRQTREPKPPLKGEVAPQVAEGSPSKSMGYFTMAKRNNS